MARALGKPPQQRQIGEALWEAFRKTLGRPLSPEQTVAALVAYELRQVRLQLERIARLLEETELEPEGDDVVEPGPSPSPWDVDGVQMPPPTLTSAQAATMIDDADARLMRAVVDAIVEKGPEAVDALATRALAGDADARAELRKMADR